MYNQTQANCTCKIHVHVKYMYMYILILTIKDRSTLINCYVLVLQLDFREVIKTVHVLHIKILKFFCYKFPFNPSKTTIIL